MKHIQYQQPNHRKRGRPSLSARVYIEPVYETAPNLERLAQALNQYARNLRVE